MYHLYNSIITLRKVYNVQLVNYCMWLFIVQRPSIRIASKASLILCTDYLAIKDIINLADKGALGHLVLGREIRIPLLYVGCLVLGRGIRIAL